MTGRAAHGRVARLFQTLLLHEEGATPTAADDDHTTKQQSRWIDTSPYATTSSDDKPEISFLWENAPRYETKSIRDTVQVYSHLPNGIHVLDDKWALARLMMIPSSHNCSGNHDEALATLESHCFRGSDGFRIFAQRVGLLSSNENDADNNNVNSEAQYQFEDLLQTTQQHHQLLPPPPPPKNLWVIKDAMSNGAGGIWIVDPFNAHEFTDNNNKDQQQQPMILHPQHRYIAQQYAWPPTLYKSRKCHVRVYGLITSDGRAYVHERAFLHVANEIFEYDSSSSNDGGATKEGNTDNKRRERFEPSVHITNCCANSHDEDKFSGEICVELDKPGPFSTSHSNGSSDVGVGSGNGDLPLGDYFPSIAASVAMLAEKSAAYVQGGQANNGFEYLGLDFVLSSVPDEGGEDSTRRKPVAYLLEVNAPPSQDTATGLTHAEELHDEVISDLLRLWVLPHLGIESSRSENGWKCVYSPPSLLKEETSIDVEEKPSNLIVPSKAAILNKIRWAMFEKKASKEYESSWHKEEVVGEENDRKSHKCESEKADSSFDADSFVSFVRSQFPCFSASTITSLSSAETPESENIFLESGGGAQVPLVVVDAMSASLMNRDRSVVGAKYLSEARKSIASLLAGCHRDDEEVQNRDGEQAVILGANATSLLDILARMYVENELITRDDEIVIASENHLANVTPWIKAAESVGARIKWWTATKCQEQQSSGTEESSSVLSDLVTERTRIVAVSHASNILGRVRDISAVCSLVREVTMNKGHVVVDGVAAAPHLLSCGSQASWYVVSLHKLFGPHLGCLIGKRSIALQVANIECQLSNEKLCREYEMGTMNYEACAGAIALKEYFNELGIKAWRRSGDYEGVHCHSQTQTAQITSTQASGDQVVERSSALSNSAHLSIARTCIFQVEIRLLHSILGYLRKISRVRIIEDVGDMKVTLDGGCISNSSNERRIPIVTFVHELIPSSQIVEHCRNHGVICRACKFLATTKLWDEMNLNEYDGVVRFSFAHYNNISDIQRTIYVLEMLREWR